MEKGIKIINKSNAVDHLLLFYLFSLALLEVTPQYFFVNYTSIIFCLVCLPHVIKLPTIGYSKPIWFYTLQLIWLFIALFFIDYIENSAYGLASLSKNVLTAIIPALFVNSTIKLINCLWVIVLGGFCNILLNLTFGLSTLSSGIRFFSEDFQLSLNSYAHGVLIFVLAGILLYSLISSSIKKYFLIVFFICASLSLMITGSRQSFVALFAFFIFISYTNIRRFSFKNISLLLFALLVIGTIISFVLESYSGSAIVHRFSEGNEEGDGDRIMLFTKGIDLFLDSPIFGYGLDTFRFFSNYVYTHSSYSDLLFSGGFFYALLFVLFYGIIFRRMKLKERVFINDKQTIRIINIVKCILLAILVNGFFYLILNSRLALTLQFIVINFVLTLTTKPIAAKNLRAVC